jgi:tetratricopeptide (TPR) repeat protein
MSWRSKWIRNIVAVSVAAGLTNAALAIDSVLRRSTDRPAAGEIASVSQTEVVVKPKVGEPVTVPANDVLDVDYEAAPPSLRLARSQERGGRFAEALATYAEASGESPSSNAPLKAEIAFLQARTQAKVALADPTQSGKAIEQLQSFLNQNKDHYRYYDAQLLLGEVSLEADNVAGAESAFAAVAAAPWTDVQMAGKLGSARILFRQGNAAGAQTIFDEVVANAHGNDAATAARRLEAMLGQAKCLRAQGRNEEAVPIFATIVKDATEHDTRLQAEAYVGQGEAYVAGNKPKEAITRFLIVDVVPGLSQHGDLHAEALYQLAQLWPTVGQPVRGAEASAKLQEDYPNSEWAKKLGGQ